jgi:hypothetical protein
VACGSQSSPPVATGEAASAALVDESEPVAPEPALAQEFSFEVTSRREFIDESAPPATDDSAWPPTELAVALPEGVRPIRATVRVGRHIFEMETAQSADEVRAFFQTAFEARGYTLNELEAFRPELMRFDANLDGNPTGIDVAITAGGNDTLKIRYTGPRMPSVEAGGETASEDSCREGLSASQAINLARIAPAGLDSIPEGMRAAIDADLEAEVALCAGHWRAPHLECFRRYANEPSMQSQCTEVARRDSGQAPLPI